MKKPEPANFPELEAEMLKLWDTENLFERSLELRKAGKRFRFYDGPPFTSGPPHYGHLEQSTLKDAIARYKTMRGYYVPRRTGVDTHGLPIENLVEKEHDFKNKKDILAFGIDKFNQACRAVVFRHKEDFDRMYHRLGRWDDPKKTYATLDDDYIESVWRVFAQLHQKDLVYRGFKSMPYCPRCATPLSNFEVNDGYKDNVPDPSVYVKFQLVGHPDKSFLVWTTTPWTLPANAALAVAAEADYVEVELLDDGDSWRKGERLILAKSRLGVLDLRKAEYKVVAKHKGAECVGAAYEPLFKLLKSDGEEAKAAYQVYADDSVSLEDGTGILHVAPRYGETDLALGLRVGLPLLASVDANGQMTAEMGEWAGQFFKDADPHIIAELSRQGRVFAAETFEHTYPFCWRCETPLLYFAMPSWFVAVTKFRDRLVTSGKQVKWVPAHVGPGRFVKWLEGARDWAISRNRFWGAPLPIWMNEQDETDVIVVDSIAQLRELADFKGELDIHRPGIDQLVIKKDGKTYRRVEEVFDCWFESGSMPYGQDHYPFEHKAEFEASFPADFITEAIEQVHLWFYTLHVLAVALFDKPAYQNVVATGIILGADGRKLSKRLRNYPPVEEVFDEFGADVLRFFILESPLMSAGDTRLSNDALRDVSRNLFQTLWNVYSFLATYAESESWQPGQKLAEPLTDNLLDRWIISRLNQTVAEATRLADNYEINRAVRPIRELVDDLSNWYLRRSRRRFRSEDLKDKERAFQTLHYILVRISQLLAPWSPFVTDKLWRELTEGISLQESVHLSDWPEAGRVDEQLLEAMSAVREAVTEALGQRAAAGIKVRQPLSQATIYVTAKVEPELADIAAEELNVKTAEIKAVKQRKPSVLNTEITQELKLEGLARDVIRLVQDARKKVGTKVDDRIALEIFAPAGSVVRQAIEKHRQIIAAETLADKLELVKESLGQVPSKVEGEAIEIAVARL